MKETINDRIGAVLENSGLSVNRFAASIGISQPSAKAILDGENLPSYKAISGIAIGYPMISMEWLLRGEGSMLRETSSLTDRLDAATNDTAVDFKLEALKKMISEQVKKEVEKQMKMEA